MSGEKVDVLAVMDDSIDVLVGEGCHFSAGRLEAARDAVASIIEAAKLVNGDHFAPQDCYATGPFTGDSYLDLIRCPGCQLAGILDRIGATP